MEYNKFQSGIDFLNSAASLCSKAADHSTKFERHSGEKHPVTLEKLGEVVSILYKAACCFWGCRKGDHVLERMVGKAVNQAICSFQLYRFGYYDESLMITRGIGEITNLFHMFYYFPEKIEEWKTVTNKVRYKRFKPSMVRKVLTKKTDFVPIDEERYGKLCEIGTHPTPNEIPGHYTESGIPILGMIVQPAGAYVAVNELSYAIGLLAAVAPRLLELRDDVSKELKDKSVELIRNMGSINVLNFHKELQNALNK